MVKIQEQLSKLWSKDLEVGKKFGLYNEICILPVLLLALILQVVSQKTEIDFTSNLPQNIVPY